MGHEMGQMSNVTIKFNNFTDKILALGFNTPTIYSTISVAGANH